MAHAHLRESDQGAEPVMVHIPCFEKDHPKHPSPPSCE